MNAHAKIGIVLAVLVLVLAVTTAAKGWSHGHTTPPPKSGTCSPDGTGCPFGPPPVVTNGGTK